jgi:hypothetical protein
MTHGTTGVVIAMMNRCPLPLLHGKAERLAERRIKMAEYYVGCGIFGEIYAGKITPPGKDGSQMWKNKSDVTDGAIEAVVNHFIIEMDRDDKNKIQKAWGVRGNRTLKVTFELVPKQGVVR